MSRGREPLLHLAEVQAAAVGTGPGHRQVEPAGRRVAEPQGDPLDPGAEGGVPVRREDGPPLAPRAFPPEPRHLERGLAAGLSRDATGDGEILVSGHVQLLFSCFNGQIYICGKNTQVEKKKQVHAIKLVSVKPTLITEQTQINSEKSINGVIARPCE